MTVLHLFLDVENRNGNDTHRMQTKDNEQNTADPDQVLGKYTQATPQKAGRYAKENNKNKGKTGYKQEGVGKD